MSNTRIYHGSKELVVCNVTVDGAAVTSGYTLAIAAIGADPTRFTSPDTAGSSTGVMVGPGSTHVLPVGTYQVWADVSAYNPEEPVFPLTNLVQIY